MVRAWAEQTETRAQTEADHVVRRMSRRECWSRLRRHHEGRLGYLSGRGPRHVVVPYAVWDGAVVVRVPVDNEATQYAGCRPIPLDVTERIAGSIDKCVEVCGQGRLTEPEGAVVQALPDEHWPTDLPSRLVWLAVDDLHGLAAPVVKPTSEQEGR